ncbi:MAG: response regulator [Planctomycetes bacterium]|nr:response regulator [Planctomycetota bacterium]
MTNPALQSTTLGDFFSKADTDYMIAKMAIEEFYDGEMYLIFALKNAITVGSIILALDDAAVRENANKGVLDNDCTDAFREFSNQVCGMLDNELRPKLPKPIHLRLTTTSLINKKKADAVLSDEVLHEECLILTATLRILGFDDDQFILSLSKLVGEEFFAEVIDETDKQTKATILAVDDSNTDLRIIRKLLSSEYRVMVTDHPGSALLMIQKNRIDLVLMDINMPGVDGITLCERIKRNCMSNNIPIILCSSSPTRDNVINAIRAGAVDFIAKPFTRQKLIEKIDKHLANRGNLLVCR